MSYSPPRRFADMPGKPDPEARHAQEELINAYEAEEERIINVLSRKLEKLREDKIDLGNALEAESESHVNKLARQLGTMRMEHEELKAKYEALVADRGQDVEEEDSSSSGGPSANAGRRHMRRKAVLLSANGNDKKKKRSAGKSTASSNSTTTSNGKSKGKGKEKARSTSRSPPRPEAMSRSSTLTGLNTLITGGISAAEPTMDMMLAAMKRENEHLRNRLVDTERDYIRLSRLNEIYREELLSHRRRLGLPLNGLAGTSSDPFSQPTHHRSHSSSNQNPYNSNMSSPSTSMYHIPTMNGHGPPNPSHHASTHSSKHASKSQSNGIQGVPIPRPAGEDPHAVTRRHRPKNVISSEGSTPLSRSPASDDDDEDDDDDDDDEQDFFSPGASGSASGAGSISPYPMFSPVNSSMAHYGRQTGRMRSTSGAGGGGDMGAYGYHNAHYPSGYNTGTQPASYASVDTSATSPPSSGGGMGFGGGGFAGMMMGMRGIGIPSLGAMAANASNSVRGGVGGLVGGGRGGTPMQRGLSYPSVPPPSLSSSLGSVSPSVPLYTQFRDREGGWGEGSREPSMSPVEPLSRRNSFVSGSVGAGGTSGVSGVPGGRRGSVGAGGRVAESGSLRSNTNSRRASVDYSASSYAVYGPGAGSSVLGLSGLSLAAASNSVSTTTVSAISPAGVSPLPNGARVAETGSLLRSTGRSRAGSSAGYGGYGYYLPETVDEGEGGEDSFSTAASGHSGSSVIGPAGVSGSRTSGQGACTTTATTNRSGGGTSFSSSSPSLHLDEVVGGMELGPGVVKKEKNR